MRSIICLALGLALPSLVRADGPPPEAVKKAVAKGLERLQQSAANYPKHRQCFSCHNQALPLLGLVSARARGFDIKTEAIEDILAFSMKTFGPKKENLVKGQGVGGANTTVGYALATFAAADHPPDETTAAMVRFLLARQRGDGAWTPTTNRPPSEGSLFTSTALALLGLKKYGHKDIAALASERERIDKAFAKGLDWLRSTRAEQTEDKVFRLLGLAWSGADSQVLADGRKVLLKEQHAAGGWAQLAKLEPDAYATGSVLIALRTGGLAASDPAYLKGVGFLLATQKDDGAWIVETRSKPIQTFFDNGDPGGKSQFLSITATGWAVQALLETLPPTHAKTDKGTGK